MVAVILELSNPSNKLLCVKDLTEDSEEVENRKLRSKQRMLAQLVEQVEQVGGERVHPCDVGLPFLLEGLENRLAQLHSGFLFALVALHQLHVRLHRGCSQVFTRIEINEVLIGFQKFDVGEPRRFFKVGAEPLEEPFQVGTVEGLDRLAGHDRILAGR